MLAEMFIVLVAMGAVLNLCPAMGNCVDSDYQLFRSGYTQAQSEAIRYGMNTEYRSENGAVISFNTNGNVSYPRTVHFDHHDIIVELGGGRLVEHR